MTARVLDGREVAARIRERVRSEVSSLLEAGTPPHLVSLQVGQSEPSRAYLQSQRRACVDLGILYTHVQLDEESTDRQLLAHVHSLCQNPEVTGLIIQLPVPRRLDVRKAYRAMDPTKDVEGMHPANLGAIVTDEGGMNPCTAVAVLQLVRESGVLLRGAAACVVGHSDVVGKPIGLMLLQEDATVTTCHVHTRDLARHTRHADVLIVAAGQPGLVGAEHIKPGACVIDVGINYLAGREGPVGDVRFEEASAVAGFITPVPGGVGPVTVACLLQNTVRAAKAQRAGAEAPVRRAEGTP